MWSEHKPSTRVSQLPALPPIVSSPRRWASDPSNAHQEEEPESSSNAVSRRSRDQPLGASSSRLLLLESRVSVLEQANRALLEEIVQVQADAQARQICEQEAVRNSRQELEKLRETVGLKAAIVEGLERRVFENERSIERGQGTVDLLLQSTQEVERGVRESQTELLLRLKKDQATVLVEQVRDDLYHLEQKCLRFQEGIGHDCGGLVEEVRRLRSGLDVQSVGMESAVSGIRQHLKRLEVEHDSMEGGLSRAETAIGRLESTDIQLRKQLDSKISEVGGGLVELRGALTHLENERKRQELWLKESFSQLQEDISWVSQKTGDSFHAITMEMEKNEKNSATEHAQLIAKVTTALQESSEGRVNCQKTKECLETQIGRLEKALQTECAARCSHEAEASSAVAARCEELQAKVEEQLGAMRSNMEQERQSTQRGLAAVLGSLSVLEGEERAAREDLSNVLNAEIRTRQEEVSGLQLQCGSLQEAWWRASEALREGLESLEGRMAADRNEMLSLQQKVISEWQEMGQRMMADMDTRVSTLHEHIVTSNSKRKQGQVGVAEEGVAEEGVAEEGVAEEGVALEKPADPRKAPAVSSSGPLVEWQGVMGSRVMGSRVGTLESRLDGLAVALQEQQVKLVGQVQQETNQRFHSVLDLRNEIANIHAQMSVLFEDPRAYDRPVHIAYYDGHLGRGDGPLSSAHFEAGESRRLAVAREGSSERRGPNPLRGYTPIVPKLTQGGRPKGSELDPKVGAQPFWDWPQTRELGSESYIEDSPEEQSGSEDECTEECPTLTEATNILIIPHERDHQAETTPEPSSPHSSSDNSPRVKPSQRHRAHDRYSLPVAAQHYEAAETQGTFMSAAATPDSQQRPRATHDYTSEQEESNNNMQASVDPSASVREADVAIASDHGVSPEDKSASSQPALPLEADVAIASDHGVPPEDKSASSQPALPLEADVAIASDHGVPPEDKSASSQPALPLELNVTDRDSDSPFTAAEAEPAGNSPSPGNPEFRRRPSGGEAGGDANARESAGARGGGGAAGSDVGSSREKEAVGEAKESSDMSSTSSAADLRSQRDQGLASSSQELPSNAAQTGELD